MSAEIQFVFMFSQFPVQVHSLSALEGPECQVVRAYICKSLVQLLDRSQRILHTAVDSQVPEGF